MKQFETSLCAIVAQLTLLTLGLTLDEFVSTMNYHLHDYFVVEERNATIFLSGLGIRSDSLSSNIWSISPRRSSFSYSPGARSLALAFYTAAVNYCQIPLVPRYSSDITYLDMSPISTIWYTEEKREKTSDRY